MKKNNIEKENAVTLIEIFNLQINKKIWLGCMRTAGNYNTCIRKLTFFRKRCLHLCFTGSDSGMGGKLSETSDRPTSQPPGNCGLIFSQLTCHVQPL